jgi:hypothetical protein
MKHMCLKRQEDATATASTSTSISPRDWSSLYLSARQCLQSLPLCSAVPAAPLVAAELVSALEIVQGGQHRLDGRGGKQSSTLRVTEPTGTGEGLTKGV